MFSQIRTRILTRKSHHTELTSDAVLGHVGGAAGDEVVGGGHHLGRRRVVHGGLVPERGRRPGVGQRRGGGGADAEEEAVLLDADGRAGGAGRGLGGHAVGGGAVGGDAGVRVFHRLGGGGGKHGNLWLTGLLPKNIQTSSMLVVDTYVHQ